MNRNTEVYSASEIITEILRNYDFKDLYYFVLIKHDLKIKYGRKGYNYEKKIENKEEIEKFIKIVELMDSSWTLTIFE